ncbi:homocysteine S-methyltransferase family protein [Aspergillus saccharolyticus JOP 1030-1]|uniref:Homocysteine S-methyltransferase n=1 Tax=Aspergillus saccharolyticus JOP 1030-1 TaxID=1450539 RepID=A0A318Z2R2_9EURO|nr:Homocysteine S-methyltransferase [Aspergillus saccharolyticus JOP 1030-1]PYH41591.1 Homocysteine S-methyltransferase [Aspergillus saccharolyticus JOP 1030-1]
MTTQVPILILDGGLGTTLQDHHSITFTSTSTPLWSSHLLISSPSTLLACQRSFVTAGSDVLLTATYQVSTEGFSRTKTPEFPTGIPRAAIAPYIRTGLSVAADATANTDCKVALSLGPYGACMIPGQEYSGAYDAAHNDEESLFQWHLERLRLIVDAVHETGQTLQEKVQYVAFETLPRLDEVRAVRRAARAAGLDGMGIPFWVVCVFPIEGRDELPDGSSVEEVVAAALGGGDGAGAVPWGIGLNCTKVHRLERLVKLFEDGVQKVLTRQDAGSKKQPALVLYPDGTQGEVYNTTTQVWENKADGPGAADSRPWEVQLAEVVNHARASGQFSSILVGGCCKASHHDIAKLRQQFS